MMQRALFRNDSRTAARQPKTGQLILARYLKDAAEDWKLDEAVIDAAHAVLIKWADLETSGRLAERRSRLARRKCRICGGVLY
jgi:hypothetical protein